MQVFARSFGTPDTTTTFPNGCEEVVEVQGGTVARLTLRPGWRWSNDVRPLMGSESCPKQHAGYCLSGSLHVEMDDGTAWRSAPATSMRSHRATTPGWWATRSARCSTGQGLSRRTPGPWQIHCG